MQTSVLKIILDKGTKYNGEKRMRMKGGQTERRKEECHSAKSLFSNLPLDDSCFSYILEN